MFDHHPAFSPERASDWPLQVFPSLLDFFHQTPLSGISPHFLYSYSALEIPPLSHGFSKKPVSSAAHSRAVHATPNNSSSSSAKRSLHVTVAGFQPKITESEFIPGSANSLFLQLYFF